MVKGATGGGGQLSSGPSIAAHRQSTTYQGMAPISNSQNPYKKYTSDDGDSIDDGINLGEKILIN